MEFRDVPAQLLAQILEDPGALGEPQCPQDRPADRARMVHDRAEIR